MYTGGRPRPPSGTITMVEVKPQENVLLGRMGEGSGHQRQYNCGKSGHLANVCPSKYKVATKTDKMEGREVIFIQTANISNSTL